MSSTCGAFVELMWSSHRAWSYEDLLQLDNADHSHTHLQHNTSITEAFPQLFEVWKNSSCSSFLDSSPSPSSPCMASNPQPARPCTILAPTSAAQRTRQPQRPSPALLPSEPSQTSTAPLCVEVPPSPPHNPPPNSPPSSSTSLPKSWPASHRT